MKCDNYQQNRSSWTTETLPNHFSCNNLSWTEVVEPRSTRVNHVWLFINFALRENIFWHFAPFLQSTSGSEFSLNDNCFMCIFRLHSFFNSLLQRVHGVGWSKCLALACLLALLRSANWLPHILHSNLENITYNQGAR